MTSDNFYISWRAGRSPNNREFLQRIRSRQKPSFLFTRETHTSEPCSVISKKEERKKDRLESRTILRWRSTAQHVNTKKAHGWTSRCPNMQWFCLEFQFKAQTHEKSSNFDASHSVVRLDAEMHGCLNIWYPWRVTFETAWACICWFAQAAQLCQPTSMHQEVLKQKKVRTMGQSFSSTTSALLTERKKECKSRWRETQSD